MGLYTYKVRTSEGEIIEDTIQANDKAGAVTAIQAKGFQILTLKSLEGGIKGSVLGGVSVADKAAFCRFVATMLRSGMSLPEAIDIIRQETPNKRLQKILTDVSYQTQKGKSLSTALSGYKDTFDAVFLTMIKAGEESGTLDKSFDYLSEQLTASHELSQKIKGSMMYPAIIVLAMMGNGLLMAIFVLPRIAGAFLKLDVPLPAYTKIVLGLGKFFGDNIPLVLGAFALGGVLSVLVIILPVTRNFIIRILARLPVISKLVRNIDLARFARTLSTLLKSGVPIIQALDVSADSMSQPDAKKTAHEFSQQVSKGESLSDVFVASRDIFPSIVIQTIKAGEKSGSLDKVLEELATFYESEIEFSLKRLTSLLEPVLMLIIGVVVAIMVIMMIAPIYSIIGGLQQTISGN